jgi:putative RNA 2'-phosphotransferase
MATRLSKFLSLVLRHRPDEYRLAMDELGFVDFDSLIDVLAAEDIVGENAEEIVETLVEESDRPRFEIRDGRIRALYGHSSRIQLALPETVPPDTLYHGTTPGAARSVREEGLLPAGRAYVHLSGTAEEARSIGSRHCDDPILVEIDTAGARDQGIVFHHATELIWLCGALPADVCRVPDYIPEEASAPSAPPRPRPMERPAPPTGVRIVEPSEDEGFKRRTRKKGRR